MQPVQSEKEVENKLKFLSGPLLEKSRELDHAQQAGVDRTDTRLEQGGGPRPRRPPLASPGVILEREQNNSEEA